MTKQLGLGWIVLAACGGGGDPGSTTDTPDAAPACVAADVSTTVMVPAIESSPGTTSLATWTLDAVLSATSVLAHADDAAGAQHLAVIDDTKLTELAVLPDAAHYRLLAAPVAGTACAVVASKVGLSYACPGQPLETASTIRDIGSDFLYAVPTAAGLEIFGQTFASFTVIERTAANAWREDEQYESSISYPTDATLADGHPIACFIDAGDRAVVSAGTGRYASTLAARWCKLAVDGGTVHVLTDTGYAALPTASLVAEGTLALTPLATATQPARLVMLDGVPNMLTIGDHVTLTPIPSGTPVTLPIAITGGTVVDWDPTTRAVVAVTSTASFAGSGPLYPQTIRYQRACL